MNFRFAFSALALASAVALAPAHAAPTLIAKGSLAASGTDLSGFTNTLESGVPANLLGGMGSGLAWAGGTTFLSIPDRGPNANPWNPAVDDTTSFVPRFHTLDLVLTPAVGGSLPFELNVTLQNTTPLWTNHKLNYGPVAPLQKSTGVYYFSGRSDNFKAGKTSTDSTHARLDPEGIRVSKSGKMVYITDEYGPFVYGFNRATGRREAVYNLPAKFAVANLFSQGSAEISGNTSGRVANKGMEGLAITPDGKTLIGFVQSPLIQDGGDGGRMNRIVTIDVASHAVKEYAYDNYISAKSKAYNSSEILALNSHEFLVLERDGKGLGDGSTASVKQVWKVDLAGATEVSALTGSAALQAVAPAKTLFLDVRAALNAAGFTDALIPAKLEGMAFGKDVVIDGATKHTLYIANDNDFNATVGGLDNPNQFFVFAFDDADLNGSVFVNQTFAR
jgi:hypothetical protein